MTDLVLMDPERGLTTVGKPDGKISHIYLLLDASGSMWEHKNEHLGGVNAFLEKMKMDGNAYRVVVETFNESEKNKEIRNCLIEDLGFITNEEYLTTGATPLLDSTWGIIGRAEKETKEEDRVVVVIQTDGEENSSIEVKLQSLKTKIEDKRKDGWLFEFLGAGVDNFVGASMGIARASTTTYNIPDSTKQWNATYNTIRNFSSTGRRPEDNES